MIYKTVLPKVKRITNKEINNLEIILSKIKHYNRKFQTTSLICDLIQLEHQECTLIIKILAIQEIRKIRMPLVI